MDKSGVDYITHPRTVASFCEGPKEKIVALLHDVIEDTQVTEADLQHNMNLSRLDARTADQLCADAGDGVVTVPRG